MSENWKKIQGYENYEVSSLGRVRSIKFGKEKILKHAMNNRGYLYVSLCKNGKAKSFRVHQLVAIAFLNHKPNGMKTVINHINFIRTDNRLENLEITTARENANQKHLKSTSKFIGVHWSKQNKKWKSSIRINRSKPIHLGHFINEEDAGEMYQLALANIELYNGNKKQFRELIKTIKVAA